MMSVDDKSNVFIYTFFLGGGGGGGGGERAVVSTAPERINHMPICRTGNQMGQIYDGLKFSTSEDKMKFCLL